MGYGKVMGYGKTHITVDESTRKVCIRFLFIFYCQKHFFLLYAHCYFTYYFIFESRFLYCFLVAGLKHKHHLIVRCALSYCSKQWLSLASTCTQARRKFLLENENVFFY